MFDRNICQFVPHKKTQLDLQPLHFVFEAKEIRETDCELSVYRIYCVLEGEALFKPLRKAVDKRTYIAMDIVPLKIVGARLGNQAGIYGAYLIAKNSL